MAMLDPYALLLQVLYVIANLSQNSIYCVQQEKRIASGLWDPKQKLPLYTLSNW